MYNLIKNRLSLHHQDEGRKLLQQIYTSDADLVPDYANKTLNVELHNLKYRKDDKVVQYSCEKIKRNRNRLPRNKFEDYLPIVIILTSAEIKCAEDRKSLICCLPNSRSDWVYW